MKHPCFREAGLDSGEAAAVPSRTSNTDGSGACRPRDNGRAIALQYVGSRSGSRCRSPATSMRLVAEARSPLASLLPAVLARLEIRTTEERKQGSVLNSCEDPHRLVSRWHSCLFGAWRSVGSPPPDTAVWGRPSYVLPVWRNVITKTTERILTGPVYRSIPAATQKTTKRGA